MLSVHVYSNSKGIFPLLLFAEKLQGDVSPDVVKACETVIRVHGACVMALDIQYQVSSDTFSYPMSC